jgi:hypothetical protein
MYPKVSLRILNHLFQKWIIVNGKIDRELNLLWPNLILAFILTCQSYCVHIHDHSNVYKVIWGWDGWKSALMYVIHIICFHFMLKWVFHLNS